MGDATCDPSGYVLQTKHKKSRDASTILQKVQDSESNITQEDRELIFTILCEESSLDTLRLFCLKMKIHHKGTTSDINSCSTLDLRNRSKNWYVEENIFQNQEFFKVFKSTCVGRTGDVATMCCHNGVFYAFKLLTRGE